MGVFYTSVVRFFGARAVPKDGFWQDGGDFAGGSEKTQDGGSYALHHCPCCTGQVPSSNQIQNDYWDTPSSSSYKLLVNFLF